MTARAIMTSGVADDQAEVWSSTAGSCANNALSPRQHVSPVRHLPSQFLCPAARPHLFFVARHEIGPDRVPPMRQTTVLEQRMPPPETASVSWQPHNRRGLVLVGMGVPPVRSKRFALGDAVHAALVHPLRLVQAAPGARMEVAEMAKAKKAVAHATVARDPNEPSGTWTNPSNVGDISSTSHTGTRKGFRLLPNLLKRLAFFLPAKLDDPEGAGSGRQMHLQERTPATGVVVRDSARLTARAHPAQHSDDSRRSGCTVQTAREPHAC